MSTPRVAGGVPALSQRVLTAYVVAKVAIAVLETLFSLYYVDVFLNVWGLTNKWFYVSRKRNSQLGGMISGSYRPRPRH